MPLTKFTSDINIIQALADLPNDTNGLTASQLKAKFDEAAGKIKLYLNDTLIAELESTTDSASGADRIGATGITGVTGVTVQAILESLNAIKTNLTGDHQGTWQGFTPSQVDQTVNQRISTLEAEHSDQNVQTVVIPHGLSTIETDQKTPLEIKADGRTLVNHMGIQGKFESLFNRWNANLTIDTATYKFGTSSGKIDNSAGTAEKISYNTQKLYLKGKYVLLGVWARAVSGNPQIDTFLAGRDVAGAPVNEHLLLSKTIDNTWKLYWAKGDFTTKTADHWLPRLDVNTFGTANDVVNFDGMVVYELTQAQYNEIDILTSDEVAEKYGYVDSVKHIQNPVFVSYGKNLLPPFTEWTLHANATVISPYELELVATGTYQNSITDYIKVLSSTAYTISFSANGGEFRLRQYDKNQTLIKDSAWTTTTSLTETTHANCKFVKLEVSNGNTTSGTFTFTNPQLELGSVATTFEAQNKTYLYGKDMKLGSNLDGSVADQLLDRNSMLKRFELDKVLDSSLGWSFDADKTGFKVVKYTTTNSKGASSYGDGTSIITKYDGKIIPNNDPTLSADGQYIHSGTKDLRISISDTDSGWTDAMTGTTITANFIKGYFNGWKYTGDGTTHSWAQINDATITSTSDTFVADPANSHVDWTPYELSYELADSVVEPVTMEGALNLIEGLNQVEYGEGVIVREKANPKEGSVSNEGRYFINADGSKSSSLPSDTELDYKSDQILSVYKNGEPDELWKVVSTSFAYGKVWAEIPEADFDTTAQYTVTYLVLDKHLFTANAIEAEGTYNTNLKTVVDNLVGKIADLNTKQSIQDIWNDDVGVTGDKLKVQVGNASASVAVTFDQAFSAVPRIYPSDVTAKTATGFTMNASGGDWIAIGNK
jgi:hypothetical protein